MTTNIHPQFNVLKSIYEGDNIIAYQAIRVHDQLNVILKTHISEYPSLKELANLKHEYTLLNEISFSGIIKAYDLIKYQNRFFIVIEDIKGKNLKEWMQGKIVKLQDFYKLALQLAEILECLHSHKFMHKDIKPQNIVINPQTLELKLIDFSLTSRLTFETSNLVHPGTLEGTLAYMSPEQTGRMNRLVDHRTDFYSLGVTFYEMLTGQLPFEGLDALELVYAHLAKAPKPVHEINPQVPQMLSYMISKLMAKNADDRYFNAFALKEDLLESQRLWLEGNTLSQFKLGLKDIKSSLIISQKLYGREEETQQLLSTFERVSNTGKSEMALVAGFSGIGKSVFIQEIYKPLSRLKGYFIRGKFDLLQKNTSYIGFSLAFKELISYILTEPSDILEAIKQEILEAVGPNGQLIIDLIPDLEFIIGKQNPVAELLPKEAQNRFNIVFHRFVNVFAKKEHPLVIFLDDLQWSDHASLNLIEQLLLHSQYLLIIGAYRDNEVHSYHPLLMTIEFLNRQEIPLEAIKLGPLSESNVINFLEDTFGQGGMQEFASLIIDKTKGNPFFINEFLKALYQNEVLTVSPAGVWEWDMEAIKEKAITSNVVDLMVDKIKTLPSDTQKVLAIAAFIGNLFDLTKLATICQKSPSQVAEILWPAAKTGLILTIGSAYKQASILDERDNADLIQYKFLHDKVQEAAIQLVDPNERKEIHLMIGRLLLQDENKIKENLLEIVGHLNMSLDLIKDPKERRRLSELNFLSGEKSKASSAYESALAYFKVALDLLPENSWKTDYDFTFKVNRDLAECTYLVGRFDDAETHLMQIKDRATSVLDKVEVYCILVVQLTNLNHYKRAIEFGVEGLRLLGLNVTATPSPFDVLKEFLKLKLKLKFTSARDKLADLPPMTDPKYLKMVQLMYFMAPPTYIFNQALHIVIGLRIVHITIDHGYTQGSLMGFLCYLLVVATKLHDYKEADFWAKLMVKYAEKAGHIDNYTYFCLGAFYRHWNDPYHETFDYFQRSIKSCLEEGDLNFYAYNSMAILGTVHAMGKPLADLKKASEDTSEIFKAGVGFYNAFCLNTYLINSLQKAVMPEQEKVDQHLKNVLANNLAQLFIQARLTEFYYLFNEYDQALDASKKAMKVADNALGFTFQTTAEFYHGLALAACLPKKHGKEKQSDFKALKNIQKTFKIYSTQCPSNYLSAYLFLSAEIAVLEGDDAQASELYDQVIDQAKTQDFIHHVAFACERAAQFYLSKNKERIAKSYMQDAHYYYTLWGAALKVKILEDKYPYWLKKKEKERSDFSASISHHTNNYPSTTLAGSHTLDFLSILKATRTISSEIVLSELLKKLIKILMENAGAQRGALIIEKENSFWVEVESFLDEEDSSLITSPVNDRKDFPISIFSYVQRTGNSVVLGGATHHQFMQDPYLMNFKPKSILCIPIMHQHRIIGLLYLENNAIEGAFTQERIEVLSLLSAQAAISLENARLYEATGQFVPVQFLEQLRKRSIVDIHLGDNIQQDMSVLFCDIRNFTTFSESKTPEEVFTFINDFLGCMEPCIEEQSGFIDKYIGDAIMALFKGGASNALTAAISMIKELEKFNAGRNQPIEVGIGINSGEIILGIMGGKRHLAGSVLGDVVNAASRIEGLTKVYGTPLLIGENTKNALINPSQYNLRSIDKVVVKGKAVPIDIWEVCDVYPDHIRELKMSTLDLFNNARQCFLNSDFDQAHVLFQECLRRNPYDSVLKLYIQRCSRLNSKEKA